MKPELKQQLLKKGWRSEEIEKTAKILKDAEKDSPFLSSSSQLVYWMALVVAVIGNFVVSVLIIPFLLSLKTFALYIVIALIGICFGFLVNLLIKDIDYLDPKHHIIAGIFIPAVALINIFIVTAIVNYFITATKLNEPLKNPLAIAFIYVIAFLFSYLYEKIAFLLKK